ncbi:MAG: hypothetical protein WBM08_15225 [Prochlorococcaceae cyanobacterium]
MVLDPVWRAPPMLWEAPVPGAPLLSCSLRSAGATPGSFFIANVQAQSLSNGNLWGSDHLGEDGQINLIQQQPPLI